MSTFLVELLNRAVQPAPVVTPRHPARFEVPDASLTAAPAALGAPGVEQRAEAVSDIAAAQLAPLAPVRPLSAPGSLAPLTPQPAPAVLPVRPTATPAVDQAPTAQAQARASSAGIAPAVETLTRRMAPVAPEAEVPGHVRLALPPAAVMPAPPIVPARVVAPAGEPPRAVRVTTRPVATDAPAPWVHQPPAVPAVNVRVHIGRIEVHTASLAPRPPAPVPTRAAPAPLRPATSLDDYLRRKGR